jgi:hypothetical protein
MPSSIHYAPSRRCGPALILLPAFGLGAAVLLGYVYGYVQYHNCILSWVSLLFPCVYALPIAFGLRKMAVLAHCRNDRFYFAVCIATAVAAIYCCWAAFLSELLTDSGNSASYLAVFFRPHLVGRLVLAIGEQGWCVVANSVRPSGALNWLLWGGEAAIIVGIIAVVPMHAFNNRVFCEDCGRWCELIPGVKRFDTILNREQNQRVVAGDLSIVPELTPSEFPPHRHLRLDAFRCPRCARSLVLQVSRSTPYRDKKNQTAERVVPISPLVLLTPEAAQSLDVKPKPEATNAQRR